ncbi:MAG: protein-L-isoaspartate(D-aspartate) O-methyltransferase [Enterovirga sp.]|nr:protein-L-isoaspartate(D-aspartate) O-methyltransferase [Enterovirga sp.]
MLDFAQARRTMVDCQLRTFDVTDRAILAAMGSVPRESFMPPGRAALAYVDQNVTVGDAEPGQRVILQPMVLGRLIQALEIEVGTRVLDVAPGLGYSSALLAALGASVVALDSKKCGDAIRASVVAAGYGSAVETRTGPLAAGCAEFAPFEAVLINGAVEAPPSALLDQLAPGGRLACLHREQGATHGRLFIRAAGGVSSRVLFEASAPVLEEFRAAPGFTF